MLNISPVKKPEGPSPGSRDAKMLIFKAVQKFIGNKTRRTRPDEDAHELDCMPPIKKATNYYLEFSLHIKTKT